jgi:hypothetical protein
MKRTITEILIEVEETVLVRQKEKTEGGGNSSRQKEIQICPNCGHPVAGSKSLEREKKNEKHIDINRYFYRRPKGIFWKLVRCHRTGHFARGDFYRGRKTRQPVYQFYGWTALAGRYGIWLREAWKRSKI